MHQSRHTRFVTALIALFGMLFMQLAVAAYACPELAIEPTAGAAMMPIDTADQTMADCHGMDPVQPSLCHAHDQAGNQSLDKPGTPQVPPYFASGLALTLLPIEVAYRQTVSPPQTLLLTRTTAPPLSIRHCCFRI